VPPLQGEQVALMLHAEDAVPVSSPRLVPVVEPICAEVLWAALGAVLDLCEQDVSMVSSPSSSISTCASPSASVLTHSTMSSAAYSAAPAPTRATLKILIVDDNVRERVAVQGDPRRGLTLTYPAADESRHSVHVQPPPGLSAPFGAGRLARV
jgi:hypothetical protein